MDAIFHFDTVAVDLNFGRKRSIVSRVRSAIAIAQEQAKLFYRILFTVPRATSVFRRA